MSKQQKIFITGASGFIGKHLVQGLSSDYELHTPGHHGLDLLDERAVGEYLKRHQFDAVIHCAAVGIGRNNNLPEAVPINLRMFNNLARCNKLYGKMIFFGSGAEYDKRRDLVKVKETDFDASAPADPYGFYKYLCSKFIANTANIINLRVFAVFGPGEDYATRFISNVICRSLFNLPVTINQDVKFDYFYVNDLVKIVNHFVANNVQHQFYNIGRGQAVTLTEIVKKIETIADKKLDVAIKQPGFNKEYTCDNFRLIKEMDHFKFMDFDDSLKQLYNWYNANLQEIDKSKLEFDK